MKNIKFKLIIVSILFTCFSCEDVFDKQPLSSISDTDVWQDEALIRAYVSNMYVNFQWNAFAITDWYNYSDEGTVATGRTSRVGDGATRTNDNLKYWDYGNIRDLNVFLEKIGDAPIFDGAKKQMEGEVRVLRAMAYFEMQKRYGGVPLVDIVLNPFAEIDEQYTKRATEEQIADFIDSELEVAIGLLSEDNSSRGQINKWTAFGFKARVNLWSASIAKYGSVEIDGLVGIPSSRMNDLYAKASVAADSVIASGKYSLYKSLDDKSENYRMLFLDESNNEVIFEKIYDGENLGHTWDVYCAPPTVSDGRGATADPILEFMLGYENIDGSTDQPEFGEDHLYTNAYDPFENKDPRLHATVFFQGDNWAGNIINTYEGTDPSVTPDPDLIIDNPSEIYNGIPAVGADSRNLGSDDKSTSTGFIVKKYIRNESLVGDGFSSTNWIYMRLAEMYLIKAEAEFALGNMDDAADALNATRERAGISLVDASTITQQKVWRERDSELAFELPFRYWDLRRLRQAEDVLTQRFNGLRIIFHAESGQYYFLPFECETFSRVFRAEHYYQPITDDRIANNPDLIENPLY